MGFELHLIDKVKKIMECHCCECGNDHTYQDDGIFHYPYICNDYLQIINSEFPELYSEIMMLVVIQKEKNLSETRILELAKKSVKDLLSDPLKFGKNYGFSEYGSLLEMLCELVEQASKKDCMIKIQTSD